VNVNGVVHNSIAGFVMVDQMMDSGADPVGR